MKRARIATPIVILGITIAASVFVLTRPRPSPFSPDGTVAIECAGVITHAYDSSVIYACRCKAAEGGELFLDGVKVADVPPSTSGSTGRHTVDGATSATFKPSRYNSPPSVALLK